MRTGEPRTSIGSTFWAPTLPIILILVGGPVGCSTRFKPSSRNSDLKISIPAGNAAFPFFNARISASNQAHYELNGMTCNDPLAQIRVRVAGTALQATTNCLVEDIENVEYRSWSVTMDLGTVPDGLVHFVVSEARDGSTQQTGEITIRKVTDYCENSLTPNPSGDGTPEHPFLVCNLEQFRRGTEDHGSNPFAIFMLMNDLDGSQDQGPPYKPIENFGGILIGNGFSISKLDIRPHPHPEHPDQWIDGSPMPSAYGIFGANFSGRINILPAGLVFPFPVDIASEFLFVKDIRVNSMSAPRTTPTGSLIGEAVNGALTVRVFVKRIDVTGVQNVGGIAGSLRTLPLETSQWPDPILANFALDQIHVAGDSNVGGIVGQTRRDNFNTTHVGGAVSGILLHTGFVVGSENVGGIVGNNAGWVETNSILTQVTIHPRSPGTSNQPSYLQNAGCAVGLNQDRAHVLGISTRCIISPSSGIGAVNQWEHLTNVGGLIGLNEGNLFRSQTEAVLVLADDRIGGAVGLQRSGSINDIAVDNAAMAQNPFTGSTPSIGGAIGRLESAVAIERVRVTAWIFPWGPIAATLNFGFLGSFDAAHSAQLHVSNSFVNMTVDGNQRPSARHPISGEDGYFPGVRNLTHAESLDASSYVFSSAGSATPPLHWRDAPGNLSLICAPTVSTTHARPWNIPATGTLASFPKPEVYPICIAAPGGTK